MYGATTLSQQPAEEHRIDRLTLLAAVALAAANDKVTRTVATHPSMHEETLDHILIMELTAAPPAFFAAERMGVAIESHWLGSRWMFGRREIADVAFFVSLR
jgi:hypothetical protein